MATPATNRDAITVGVIGGVCRNRQFPAVGLEPGLSASPALKRAASPP